MTKVSIVMPTYNVEKYFRQCIESVINQTLTDIEIIPVDDGSPDNCGAIMDEYAQKDPRVKPIHKPNGGYGSAVNTGIEAATGEYIGIVETDDWVEPEMYEKLYNQAKKLDADVCKASFYRYNSKAINKKLENQKWQDEIQNIEEYPQDRAFKIKEFPRLFMFHASIWSNIYKAEFLKKNNIIINGTRSASYQDFPFMAEVMCKADKIAVLHDYLYHWRVEEGQNSSTNQKGSRLLIMPDQCEEVKNIVKKCGLYEDLKEAMYKHFFLANFSFYNDIQPKYRKQYFDKLKILFQDLNNDTKFEYKYFYDCETKFIKNIEKGNYYLTAFKSIRRRFIQLKFNSRGKYLKLFGKTILGKDNSEA